MKRSKMPQDGFRGPSTPPPSVRRNSSPQQRSAGRSRAVGTPTSAAQSAVQAVAPVSAPSVGAPNLLRILNSESATRWMGWRARDYTPERIEQVLSDALAGDIGSQWELFSLMEDTWPRLAKALSEVKRAAVQMEWRVEPWAEDGKPATDEAKRRARLVSHAIWTMTPPPDDGANGFGGTVFDLLDAWGKGVSVLETTWEARQTPNDGMILAPKATYWVDPRNYAWQGSTLRLRAPWGDRSALVEFPAHRFLIGICKSRSGPLSGTALLRPLAWWWCACNFSAAWLLNLAQIFGLPIRWANYAPGAEQATIDQICGMLENMGSSSWGAFPAGTSIELHESSKGAGQSPQDSLLDRADKQVDLLILGQTLTTDVGQSGSLALGGVHKGVLSEIKRAAADWAADVLNQQLVRAICQINWGTDMMAPELCPEEAEQRDLVADANRLKVLKDAGLEIPKAWAHESQQIPIPQAGEEVLAPSAPADPYGMGYINDRPLQRDPETDPESDPEDEVEARRAEKVSKDPVDAIAAARAVALGEAYRGSLAPIRKLVEMSTSREDLQQRIREWYADWSPARAAVVASEAFEIMAAAGAKAGAAKPRG